MLSALRGGSLTECLGKIAGKVVLVNGPNAMTVLISSIGPSYFKA
jgi:hypothetical protein